MQEQYEQRLFTIVLFATLATAICCAQVATGNLQGTVSDSTGGLLPNCAVTITHISTGLVRKVLTNEQGDFNVPSLPVGEYRIAIGLPGFQTKILSGLTLQVEQTANVPVGSSLEPLLRRWR